MDGCLLEPIHDTEGAFGAFKNAHTERTHVLVCIGRCAQCCITERAQCAAPADFLQNSSIVYIIKQAMCARAERQR